MDSSQSLTADFVVATDGLEENLGTFERPYATLHQAKLAVNQKEQNFNRPISVIVRSGTYYLEQPFIFNSADSGTPNPSAWKSESTRSMSGRLSVLTGIQFLLILCLSIRSMEIIVFGRSRRP
jgi:hypothetical protein